MPYQVIYSSRASGDLSMPVLEAILERARERNAQRDITGVLIFVDGVFMQVLEGDKTEVCSLMSRIEQDPLHSAVTVFYEGEQDERLFGEWRMAYVDITRDEMASWFEHDGTVSMHVILQDITANPTRAPSCIKSILQSIGS